MGTAIEGRVGPIVVQDGAGVDLRLGKNSELIIAQAHGRFTEGSERNNTYSIATASGGGTVAAGNVAPPAAAAATLLTVYNPYGSNINASINTVQLMNVSGTPGAGGFMYCVIYNTVITATQNAVPKSNYASGKNPVCRGFAATALTGGLVHTNVRLAGFASFAAAVAAANFNLGMIDKLDGEIVLPPGAAFTVAAAATGTSHVVAASISWEEKQIP